MAHTRAAETVWQSHRQWSLAADAARRHLDRWRRRNLVLLATGALAGALAAQTSWVPNPARAAFGVVGAVILGSAGVVQQRLLGPDRVTRWTGARAASEALKAETFRYLAAVGSYAGSDRDTVLAAQLDEVHKRAASFLIDFQLAAADGMPLPEVNGFASYVTLRAEEQAGWHQRKVAEHARQAKHLRDGEFAVTLAGAALAAIAGSVSAPDLSAWVGVATTIGAALAAHLAATQHDRIATSYAKTADQLERLTVRIDPDTATQDERARFVLDVERILAAQNDSWLGLLTG